MQELPAVEGLARVDVLCIDKTGTLTEGELALDARRASRRRPGPGEPVLAAIAAADEAPNATMRAIGDALPERGDGWTPDGRGAVLVGAEVERRRVRGHGAWILGGAGCADRRRGDATSAVATHADAGRAGGAARTRRRARRRRPARRPSSPVALVVLADRVRPDAAETLRYFAEQEVRVKVISGDAPRTVGAIALASASRAPRIPSTRGRCPRIEAALADVLESHRVFGRVTPQQKRAMVDALQARGHTVAMTGDGVNDALALKDADIGIAMGSGSDATRAVAQLVLLDANFDALPEVVAEGRRVLGNIERTSGLYLTKTVYAMLLSLAVGVAAWSFPFLPRHLTLIGALTIGIPSFFLALAPNADRFRPGFVRRVLPLRDPDGVPSRRSRRSWPTRSRPHEPGVTTIQAQTTAVMVLTFIGLLVLSIMAAPLNRWRLALIWSMGALAVLAFVLPATQTFFALDPPPLTVWLASIGIASLTWSFARFFVPEERPVGTRWRAGDD